MYNESSADHLSRGGLDLAVPVSAHGGRQRQKRRTRAAILRAAAALLAEGHTPSVPEVADAADVSRRTVYQYFPSLDQLLTEAALEAVRDAVVRAIEPAEQADDVSVRLDAMVRATQRSTLANESLLRKMIRLTAERSTDEPHPAPTRGYRRVEWIEMALSPLQGRIDESSLERLTSGLALCVGIEALLVLRDVRGLTVAEAEEVSVWVARALLKATMDEVGT
jgi:AcrR family transcriptional regulator